AEDGGMGIGIGMGFVQRDGGRRREWPLPFGLGRELRGPLPLGLGRGLRDCGHLRDYGTGGRGGRVRRVVPSASRSTVPAAAAATVRASSSLTAGPVRGLSGERAS